MVPLTLNPVALWVNCFFWEFVLTNGGWKLDGKHEVNLFLISDMRSQLQKGILRLALAMPRVNPLRTVWRDRVTILVEDCRGLVGWVANSGVFHSIQNGYRGFRH